MDASTRTADRRARGAGFRVATSRSAATIACSPWALTRSSICWVLVSAFASLNAMSVRVHRSDSSDSRFHDPAGTGADGSVPQSLIVGRAVALVWPLDHLTWLSNPAATFAKVPAPGSGESTPAPSTTGGG